MRNGSLFAITICAAATLCACGASHQGPKLIEADGVTYTACGGAFWIQNERAPRAIDSISYEVVYKDAQGIEHHLTRVRNLGSQTCQAIHLPVRHLHSDS